MEKDMLDKDICIMSPDGTLMDAFDLSDTEIMDDEAIKRKEEIENNSSYLKMSPDSEKALRQRAVKLGIIPRGYINAEFNKDKIQENIRRMQNSGGHKFRVSNFDTYYELCMSIINTIRVKKLPDNSFLIGAPNGFGKQSFVTDCLLASLRNGWLTVPYISLTELGELKSYNDKIIMRGLMGVETAINKKVYSISDRNFYNDTEYSYYAIDDDTSEIKTPTIVTGQYSWSEYMNAPIMICFFSGIESKMLESQVLYTTVNIRSSKGLPTIALISTSTDMYSRDPHIGRYIWREIVREPYKGQASFVDKDQYHDLNKLLHISTFKSYITSLGV